MLRQQPVTIERFAKENVNVVFCVFAVFQRLLALAQQSEWYVTIKELHLVIPHLQTLQSGVHTFNSKHFVNVIENNTIISI